jgi:hypothetical protein
MASPGAGWNMRRDLVRLLTALEFAPINDQQIQLLASFAGTFRPIFS